MLKYMKTLKNNKISILITLLIIVCLAGAAVLLFVEGPKIIRNQIENLQLTQKGMDIHATWDKMECDGYEVTITVEGQKQIIPDYQDNEYVIESVNPGTMYSFDVQGVFKDGYNSRKSSESIEAKKLKQNIKVSISESGETEPEQAETEPKQDKTNLEYDGFKGDGFNIEVKGKGDVIFETDDADVADVDDKGKVKLNKIGQCVIEATVTGDGIYEQATRKVAVNVYPEKLKTSKKITAENISETRAVISWKAVDLAKEYVLMKKNVATGNFEEYLVVNGSTQAEITRDDGDYAIKAKAVIKDTVVEGDVSEAVAIKGTTESAKTYSSSKTIQKLNESNLTKIREIHGEGNTNIPQSLSLTKDYYVISYVNSGGSAGKLISYNKDGSFAKMSSCSGMGHANGTTYNPNTNKFYVVKTHKAIRTASCSTYDGDTKEVAGTFDLPRVTSGIAYDVSNNKYYLSKGNEIYVCDSNFKVEKFIHKFVRYNHAQDIGAYNGVVLVCTWVSGNTSYIDMYRSTDGKYLGSYDVSIGEIESVVVDDGYLIILMNTLGSSKDRLYRTNERIVF